LVKAGNLNQSGDANRCGDKTAHRAGDSGYGAAHWRCRNDRGPAKYHQCVDCGDPACHWSYNYTDPDELMDTPGTQTPIPYSLSPAHYSPRCAPCHKRFDLDRAP
jgi:hypothetical protein